METFQPVNPTLSVKKSKYIKVQQLSTTLQGGIFVGASKEAKIDKDDKNIPSPKSPITKDSVIIKSTDITMHKCGHAKIQNKYIKIAENIDKEAKILKYITLQKKGPKYGYTKYIDFCKGKNNYYLIQSFGGVSMFNYNSDQHKLITQNKLSLKTYHQKVKKWFAQLVNTLNWFHNNLNLCHMDISLENLLYDETDDYINYCDFGLAEIFKSGKHKQCTKFCGKTNYKAPEIERQLKFDAKKADVWSLGVCLYMLWFGVLCYRRANMNDDYFHNIFTGNLEPMIRGFGMQDYLDDDLLDLLNHIFVIEQIRYNVVDIMKHKFLKDFKFDKY